MKNLNGSQSRIKTDIKRPVKQTVARAVAGITAFALAGTVFFANSFKKPSKTAQVSAAVDHWNDDWLHAEKDLLCDMNGNEVRITGVNWFGFNCGESVLHGTWSSVEVREQFKSIADHGFNLVRMPMSTELLVSWMNGKPLEAEGLTAYDDTMGGGVNLELVDIKTNSMLLFDKFMEYCKEYGLKVMIDVHGASTGNSNHIPPMWYDERFTTKQWIDSLVWLADKYKNDDTLIAYDLQNEPHGKVGEDPRAKWDDSTDEDNWKYWAETCGNAILEVNPNALIVVEGIEIYPMENQHDGTAGGTWTGDPWEAPAGGYGLPSNYYPGWWGGNLRGVRDYPIQLTDQSKLVYSPHDYGPSVYAQSWFDKDFTEQTLLDDYWYDTWSYIDEEGIAPLLIGEWGGYMDAGPNQKWMEILRDYMNKQHINATFWCYNPNSGDTGGLIGNDWLTWDNEKYSLVEESLWKSEGGKYIGLDHQVALGVNGVSLDEYYGTKTGDGTPPTTKATTTKSSTTATTAKTDATTKPTDDDITTATTKRTTISTPDDTDDGGAKPSPLPPVEADRYGDVDCDSKVQLNDIVLLCQAVAAEDVNDVLDAQGKANADVYDDGLVDSTDISVLAGAIVNSQLSELPKKP